jgi:CMP-N-acetylneuraminic acid synthetase
MIPKNKKIKVVIPARGGSKGVKKKNIRLLAGIPLIAYPILEAKKCKYVSNIYVSTDDTEIAAVAKKYGAEIIKRPKKYATDASPDIDAMKHVVEHLLDYDSIIHLRATTPKIAVSVLDQAIEFFLSNPSCTSLRSAHECPETAYKYFEKNGVYWKGLFDDKLEGEYYNQSRQLLPKTFHPNGYIDIIKPSWFMENSTLHGDKILAFETPYTHEIDTIDDFKILEALHG